MLMFQSKRAPEDSRALGTVKYFCSRHLHRSKGGSRAEAGSRAGEQGRGGRQTWGEGINFCDGHIKLKHEETEIYRETIF